MEQRNAWQQTCLPLLDEESLQHQRIEPLARAEIVALLKRLLDESVGSVRSAKEPTNE
jgi:hypothetical protein